jgi:DNA-binding NarL/FixJ family response regulator
MGAESISALIADRQPLAAAGLASFLNENEGIRVVAHVTKGKDLVKMAAKHQPDLLIADYNFPGQLELEDIRNAMAGSTKTNVLILSSDNNKATILQALDLGVKGYITKECSLEEVGMAVQATARGSKFFCQKVLDIIMEKRFPQETEQEGSSLTNREREILKLIAHGQSTQNIADQLYLSPHTVQTHRKSIIRKLNIKSPTEFVIYAMDLGLLKPR